jgi:hypothetical protein
MDARSRIAHLQTELEGQLADCGPLGEWPKSWLALAIAIPVANPLRPGIVCAVGRVAAKRVKLPAVRSDSLARSRRRSRYGKDTHSDTGRIKESPFTVRFYGVGGVRAVTRSRGQRAPNSRSAAMPGSDPRLEAEESVGH